MSENTRKLCRLEIEARLLEPDYSAVDVRLLRSSFYNFILTIIA